jgi:hypothetical protein
MGRESFWSPMFFYLKELACFRQKEVGCGFLAAVGRRLGGCWGGTVCGDGDQEERKVTTAMVPALKRVSENCGVGGG